MPTNARTYADQLRRLSISLPERVFLPHFRRIAFRIFELAVQNSPVDTGELRGAWTISIGTPASGQQDNGRDPQSVLESARAVVRDAQLGDTIWITNHAPHAPVYEFGLFIPPNPGPSKATHLPKGRRARLAGTVLIENGFHVSAPEGMLGDAVQQVQDEIRAGTL